MLDHRALHELTVGDLARPCDALPSSTTALQMDLTFRADDALTSLVVRDRDGRCALIPRGAFYQQLTGPLGYGYALHRSRPVLEMGIEPVPSFLASLPVVEVGIALIERHEVDRTSILLVEHEDGTTSTTTTQEVLAHLSTTFRGKVAALESSDRRFRSLIARANEVICLLDADGTIRWMSDSIRTVLGLDPESRIGHHIAQRLVAEDRSKLEALLARVARAPGEHVSGDARAFDAEGRERTLEFHGANLLDDPSVEAIVVNFRDVTERRQLEARLRHDARHDTLTELPNRAMFGEAITDLLARRGRRLAVAFVDLDGFKAVNDTLGHAAGDVVLRSVARSVRSAIRGDDLVARLGGDEFGLLIVDDGTSSIVEVAGAVVERVLDAVRQPINLAAERIVPSASIGVALAEGGEDADQLLQRADVAMYQAKLAGRDKAVWWDRGMHASVMERHLMARELRDAVRDDRLRLHYQPLVSLATGEVDGYEALLRWDRPDHGLVAPSTFICVAEETLSIIEIGRWVLRQACLDAVRWHPGPEGPSVAVNLSVRQLEDERIVADVADALSCSGLPAARLELEVTETAMMETLAAVAPRIDELRALGVRLAIDDFGVGYSSLAQLRGLAVDCVKVDRSFIAGLSAEGGDRDLVTGIVSLARALNLTVVAEGVETSEQAAAVAAVGFDRAQGFLYARPAPAARLPAAQADIACAG